MGDGACTGTRLDEGTVLLETIAASHGSGGLQEPPAVDCILSILAVSGSEIKLKALGLPGRRVIPIPAQIRKPR